MATPGPSVPFPVTPDGRYCLTRGRLRRMPDPALAATVRAALVARLRRARGELARARSARRTAGARERVSSAKRRVEELRLALGEVGEPWWDDGAPDYGGVRAAATPYAAWAAELALCGGAGPRRRPRPRQLPAEDDAVHGEPE